MTTATLSAPAPDQLLHDRLATTGFAVLRDRLPPALVDELHAAVEPAIARATPATSGFRDHRLMLPLDAHPAFQRPELWARPAVLDAVRALLGDDIRLTAINLDVNLPGSAHQPSHMDCPYLFPGSGAALPPFAIVLNVPLVDVSEELGPLELWPATHLNPWDVDQDRLIPHLPSLRPCLAAGSLLLRDIRLWHRGTPNRSRHVRPQIGLAYCRPWYGGRQVQVPAALHDALPAEARTLVGRA